MTTLFAMPGTPPTQPTPSGPYLHTCGFCNTSVLFLIAYSWLVLVSFFSTAILAICRSDVLSKTVLSLDPKLAGQREEGDGQGGQGGGAGLGSGSGDGNATSDSSSAASVEASASSKPPKVDVQAASTGAGPVSSQIPEGQSSQTAAQTSEQTTTTSSGAADGEGSSKSPSTNASPALSATSSGELAKQSAVETLSTRPTAAQSPSLLPPLSTSTDLAQGTPVVGSLGAGAGTQDTETGQAEGSASSGAAVTQPSSQAPSSTAASGSSSAVLASSSEASSTGTAPISSVLSSTQTLPSPTLSSDAPSSSQASSSSVSSTSAILSSQSFNSAAVSSSIPSASSLSSEASTNVSASSTTDSASASQVSNAGPSLTSSSAASTSLSPAINLVSTASESSTQIFSQTNAATTSSAATSDSINTSTAATTSVSAGGDASAILPPSNESVNDKENGLPASTATSADPIASTTTSNLSLGSTVAEVTSPIATAKNDLAAPGSASVTTSTPAIGSSAPAGNPPLASEEGLGTTSTQTVSSLSPSSSNAATSDVASNTLSPPTNSPTNDTTPPSNTSPSSTETSAAQPAGGETSAFPLPPSSTVSQDGVLSNQPVSNTSSSSETSSGEAQTVNSALPDGNFAATITSTRAGNVQATEISISQSQTSSALATTPSSNESTTNESLDNNKSTAPQTSQAALTTAPTNTKNNDNLVSPSKSSATTLSTAEVATSSSISTTESSSISPSALPTDGDGGSDVSQIISEPAGGRVSATALPPSTTEDRNRNGDLAFSSDAAVSTSNTDPPPAGNGAGNVAATTTSLAEQNADTEAPTVAVTNPPSVGSSFPPPPNLGSTLPPAQNDPGAFATSAASVNQDVSATTNTAQIAQQTLDSAQQSETQPAQAGVNDGTRDQTEQNRPSNSDQRTTPPIPEATEATSANRIIGSAFGPSNTVDNSKATGENASQSADNGTGNSREINPAFNKSTDLTRASEVATASATETPQAEKDPGLGEATAVSTTSDQATAAQTVSAGDPKITGSNVPAGNAVVAASQENPTDRARPFIDGLGRNFGPSDDGSQSIRPTNKILGDPSSTSKTLGVGAATSLVTSAMAPGKPTATVTGGPTPSVSITKKEPSGLDVLANAFSDPRTRPRSIGILVGVVIGFVLIVALILFLWWFIRRKQKLREDGGMPPSLDGEKGQLRISGPIEQPTQEQIANYDPSAEVLESATGLEYGPSQLDDALVNRASILSASRKSFLDIYGGANTPYPQDVVDGSGRPLTQQFLMPDADKYQLNGMGPMTPFNPQVPGVAATSSHSRNISALSNLPPDINPDQPAPTADGDLEGVAEDPFSDESTPSIAPLAAARIGTMKSQSRGAARRGGRTDSWMTVNTVATAKTGGPERKADYTSVYMANPFLDPPEAGGAGAPPPMPAIPKHLQQAGQGRHQQTESVTLMLSPNAASPPIPLQYARQEAQQAQRPLSGPGETEVMYSGILDDYPPRPPSTMVAAGPWPGRSRTVKTSRSNPFDLEPAGGGGQNFVDDGTVRSVQSWLSGVQDPETSARVERENMI